MNYLLTSGPALVFEGEEAMLAAITENPMSFKVISCFMTSSLSNNNLLTNFEFENPDLRLVA